MYKIDTGSNGNLMSFRVFGILFPMSTMTELNTTINKSIGLKTYNESNIEQLGRCSVNIRHNDKCAKCRFVVPGACQALLRMPYIELLAIIRVMCDTIDNKTTGRTFYSQTRHVVGS